MEWVDGKKDGPCKKSAFFIETRDLHIPDVFRILFLHTLLPSRPMPKHFYEQ